MVGISALPTCPRPSYPWSLTATELHWRVSQESKPNFGRLVANKREAPFLTSCFCLGLVCVRGTLTHMNICKTAALSQEPQAQASGPGFLIVYLHEVQGSFSSFWTCFLMDSNRRILDRSRRQGPASPESPLTLPSPGCSTEGICYQPGSPPSVWMYPWTADPSTPFCPACSLTGLLEDQRTHPNLGFLPVAQSKCSVNVSNDLPDIWPLLLLRDACLPQPTSPSHLPFS